ncbi:tyrosine-type recombinase/integrase [Ralstonia pseudosolanacearum]|nr:tyrosine-type recombinase/integrase [Ralstonia pseudosolanacearum]QVX40405.1 tyrosine-type recombinase/integrase [Ralstonia solanacearum]
MRRSEFLALRWQDVELQDRFVRLHDTKNGDARDVPLSTRAASCWPGFLDTFRAKCSPSVRTP